MLTRDQGPLELDLKSWSTHLFGRAHRNPASCCAGALNGNAQYDNVISEPINNSDTQKYINYTAFLISSIAHVAL